MATTSNILQKLKIIALFLLTLPIWGSHAEESAVPVAEQIIASEVNSNLNYIKTEVVQARDADWGIQQAYCPVEQEQKLSEGLPVIQFQRSGHAISDENIDKLASVLQQYKDKKALTVHVMGHSDNERMSYRTREIYGDNFGLSEFRAKAVADRIKQRLGLSNDQISIEGKGASQPIASNATAAGRRANRRVAMEIRFIDQVGTAPCTFGNKSPVENVDN